MHKCGKCGFEAQAGAHFCRQCGAPLFVEREETLAQTRPQTPSPSQPSGYPSTPAVFDETRHETTRFYRPPAHLPAQDYTVPQPKGTSSAFWVLFATVTLLAMVGLMSAVFFSARSRRDPSDRLGEEIGRRVEQQVRQQAERTARDAEQTARRAAAEALRAAIPNPRGLPVPPIPPVPGEPKAVIAQGLEDLIYPGAVVEKTVESAGPFGVRIVNLRTPDSLENIKEFFLMKLHPQNIVGASERLTLTSTEGGFNTVVKAGPHPTAKGQRQIEIVRTSIGKRR